MIKKSIRKHTRFLTCLVALAVVCATFLAGTFTTQAGVDVFGDIELKVGDTLGFVYYTSQPYTENTKMRFTVNGRTIETSAYPNDGKCVFIFDDIYPHELAKEVTATIVVDGKEIVSSTGLSIKNFLLQMLMNPQSSEQERQFASDALQYGEQTRLYRNANIDVADRDDISITDDINTSIYKNYKPHDIDSDSDFIGSAEGLGVSASNIRLTSIGIAYHNTNSYVVTLQVPANSNVDLTKIIVKIGDTEYTSTSFKAKGNGQYEVQSMPINAYDIMEGTQPHTTQFSLYVNGKVVQQASYNVLDYIYQLQDTTQSGSLALKYARALYRYGQSAENAYKGKRIISIALKENPAEIIPSSTDRQTPEEGKITAYYSDGTQQEIGSGIAWSNTDIYGNEIKIEDDTHLKQFTVRGAYRDDVSGKTFTVTGQVRLHNDITKVHRYTDPEIYRPAEFESTYTPTGTQLSCIWANGHREVRSATHDAIDMTGYQFVEYGFIPTIASYTDPKSGITLSAETFLLYENPITSITINNTTASMLNGSNTTTPEHVKYIVTYHNNEQKERDTRHSSWFNVITSGATTAKQVYSFQWSPVVYDGTEIQTTLDATGALSCPQYGAWERMLNGQTQSYHVMARNVSGQCDVVITNPEVGITIAAPPDVNGGTVLQTTPLTGHPDSTINGDLTGGSVYMLYSNGAQEPLLGNAVTYSCDSIDNADYEKEVTVTATYIGKDGTEYRNTNRINIYNRIEKVVQERTPNVPSSSSINTLFELKNTAGTLKAVYTNGISEIVGDGTTKTTNIYLNGSNRNNQCYVQSIDTAVVTNAVRMNAGTSENDTTRDFIVVSYSDYRPTTPYDGSIQTITLYKVNVVNTYNSIKPGQYTNNVTMTSATDVPAPTGAITVILSNGKECTNVTPTAYTTPTVVTSAQEMEVKVVTAQCTASDGTVITGDVNCRVINPAVSATTTVDPAPYIIPNTGKADGSKFTGGKVNVTFVNGQTRELACTTYTTNDDTKITDTTMIKLCAISGTWHGSYTSATATDMHIALQNPPKSATLLLNEGKDSSNRIQLTQSGATPTGTVTITYSNGQKTTGVQCAVQTIGVGGAVGNNTPTTKTNGTTTVTTTTKHTINDSATVVRKGNGTVKTSGASFTPSTTAYWTNPLTSLKRESGWIPAVHWETPTLTASNATVNDEKVTAYLSNGAAIANQVPTLFVYKSDETKEYNATINNCTTTASGIWEPLKASLTLDGVTVVSDFDVHVDNGVDEITIPNYTSLFAAGDTVITDTNIDVKFRNGLTSYTNAEKIEIVTNNNSGATYQYDVNQDSSVTPDIPVAAIITTYRGNEKAQWTNTYKVTYRTNLSGKPATQTFTVTYQNKFTITIRNKNNGTAPDTTGKNEDQYIRVAFNDGSTTTPSSYEGDILVTFENGATKTLTTSNWMTTDFDHAYYSRYANGESFVSKTTSNGGSLRTATATYTLDGISHSDTCYAYTRTSRHGYYFTTGHLYYRTYPSDRSMGPDTWKANVFVYGFWYNRPFNHTLPSDYPATKNASVFTNQTGFPTEWYSQTTTSTSCKISHGELNTAHISQLTRGDFENWSSRYYQYKMPTAIQMSIGSEENYNCECLSDYYRYSYQCTPYNMGYTD